MEIIRRIKKKMIDKGNNEYVKYTVIFNHSVSDFKIDFNINGVKQAIRRVEFQKKYFKGALKVNDTDNFPLNISFSCKNENNLSQIIAQVRIEYRRKVVFKQNLIADYSGKIVNFKIENIQLNKRDSTVNSNIFRKTINFKRKNYHQREIARYELNKSLELQKELSKEDIGKQIEVYFGTNRNKTNEDNVNLYFGNELDKLQYGSCIINIPKEHTQGKIERPSKILWLWSLSENDEKHITLKKIEEKSEDDFYKWIKDNLPKTEQKSALLFIHGFNTSFAEAAWRTGQIAYDTPFNDLTGFFSWPSSGNKIDYFRDIENADASILHLQKFIEDFIIKTEVKKMHIIAHSMGNRLITCALNNLVNKTSFKPYLKIIDQIVLAAPDLDQDVFSNTILPTFKNIGFKRTLYASDKDEALNLSKTLRIGKARLGQGGEDIFVSEGIDSIDASNVMSEGNHHSYIFETKELLMDMNILFEDGWEPKKRRLIDKPKKGLLFWLFRE